MSFFVRFRQEEFPLGEEKKFVVGRSETCELCVDDPLASRTHAAFSVTDGHVFVEDLGSRNGVRVNGEKITSVREIVHGDQVRVGSQELVLVKHRAARADTLVQAPTTQRLKAFGVLGTLTDKAIALGHGDEAERIIGRQLEALSEDAGDPEGLDEDMFKKASGYAVKLAALTGRGRWVDYLFQLHAARKRLMAAELVDQLYELARRVNGASSAALKDYLQVIKQSPAGLGPSERFLIGRIEGLGSLLR
jgi:hypothetical protein